MWVKKPFFSQIQVGCNAIPLRNSYFCAIYAEKKFVFTVDENIIEMDPLNIKMINTHVIKCRTRGS
jgi:hypothetical protein